MEDDLVNGILFIGKIKMTTPAVPLKDVDAAIEKKAANSECSVKVDIVNKKGDVICSEAYKFRVREWVYAQIKAKQSANRAQFEETTQATVDRKRAEIEARRAELEKLENALQHQKENPDNYYLARYNNRHVPVQPSPVESFNEQSPVGSFGEQSSIRSSNDAPLTPPSLNDVPLHVYKRKQCEEAEQQQQSPPKHPKSVLGSFKKNNNDIDPTVVRLRAVYWNLFKDSVTTIKNDIAKSGDVDALTALFDSPFVRVISKKFAEPCSQFGKKSWGEPRTDIERLIVELLEKMDSDKSPEDFIESEYMNPKKGTCAACKTWRTLSRRVRDFTVDPDDPVIHKLGSDCCYKLQSVVNWHTIMWRVATVIRDWPQLIDEIELDSLFDDIAPHVIYMETVLNKVNDKYDNHREGDLNLEPPPRGRLGDDDDVVQDQRSASGADYEGSNSSSGLD